MTARISTVFGLFIFLFAQSAAQATPPSAEDFIPQFYQFSLSPSGEYFAVLRPLNGRNGLMIQSVDNPRDSIVIPSGDNVDIANYRWFNDELLLMNLTWGTDIRRTSRPENVNGLRAISVRHVGSVIIQDLGVWGLGAIIDDLVDDPNRVLVNSFGAQGISYVGHAMEVNVYNGDRLTVHRGRSNGSGFVTDLYGRVRVLVGGDMDRQLVWTQDPGSTEWHQIHESQRFEGATIRPFKILERGRYFYLMSGHEGRMGLYRMDIEARGSMERVYLHDEYDLSGFSWNQRTGRPIHVTYMADTLQFHFFDDAARIQHDRINRLLPGTLEYVVSSDDANNRHIIYSSGPGEPPVYYIMDDEARSIQELAVTYPDVGVEQAATVEAFSYQARDGMEIPAYLALPPNAGEGPLPLVVLPHGGPHSRSNQEFDGLRQFLATRGYAVLDPNFRGSTGYGGGFYRAGLNEWGGDMQNDVTDGVRHLINQGRVDPDKICIVGWSYGAYAAMMGLVQTPNLYQCGVAINGLYDLPESQRERGRNFNRFGQAWWSFTMGEDEGELIRISPARQASRIQDPVLILYSEEDLVIPDGQHELMVEAMREAGVDFQEHVFEEGNHSMTYSPARIESYELIEDFLGEHLR